MSEYLYFVFFIHNPKSSLIREFKNTVQCTEETLKLELQRLNTPLSQNIPFTIEKIKMPVDTTFEYLYKPVIKDGHFVSYYEARRMIIDCT